MKNIYMKKERLTALLLSLCMVFLVYNCKESTGPELSGDGSSEPGKVRNAKVENVPGGANISYTLPENGNISFVKAVYSTKAKGEQEVKSSIYKDSLAVRGFADTTSKKVKLYTYNGKIKSKPITVTAHPLRPTFKKVFESISIDNAFGGLTLAYGKNNNEENITISLVQDSLGEVLSLQNEYTNKQEGKFNVHGLAPSNYKLGYFIEDAYQNRSDTLFQNITPLYEIKLDKNKFSNAKLPTDSWEPTYNTRFENIYDGFAGEDRNGGYNAETVDSMPLWITIDLGQKAKISRIIIYGLPYWGMYTNDYPKRFELWGSADPNFDDDEAFDDSWFKYGTFETKPQSETGIGISDPYPENGINYQIPDASAFPYARYFRFVVLSTYSGEKGMGIGELDIYGGPKNSSE